MPASREEIAAFLATEFPQSLCVVESVDEHGATVSHRVGPAELRPGGTVSGPVLMGVADVALYVAILGRIGIVPLAVTTDLTIHFLRKPSAERRIIGSLIGGHNQREAVMSDFEKRAPAYVDPK